MSRFGDYDGDATEEEMADFQKAVDDAYKEDAPKLKEFLTFLDSMPRKRIIADRFIAPGSGDVCAVAAYCVSKGVPREQLLETEKWSRYQRITEGEEDGVCGFGGPTVEAGKAAGLDEYVAQDLAWHNDMIWERIRVDEQGNEVHFWVDKSPPTRPMTPEERWQKLRDFVGAKVGAA